MERDDELKGQGASYSTHWRQLDPRIGKWMSIDPKSSPWESPYASMGNNPIFLVDPKGDTTSYFDIKSGLFLRTINDEGPCRNVRINADAFKAAEIVARKTQANLANQEHANQFVNTLNTLCCSGAISPPTIGTTGLISFETGEKQLAYTGEMVEGSQAFAYGRLTINSVFDDGKMLELDCYDACAGGHDRGAPQNGCYSINFLRRRPDKEGMTVGSVAFSLDLNPLFTTKRTHLRIHPDGNTLGTAGCIGLSSKNEVELEQFYQTMHSIIGTGLDGGVINGTIEIQGNPNNDGSGNSNNIGNSDE